jgi:hypothetical protein
MTIVRREHRAHFTVLPNAIFIDRRLSIEAKGVLGFLLSRPDKWSVRLEQVGRALNVGRRKLQRVFRELIGAGYVTREQRRVASAQRFGQVDYVVRDVPVRIIRPEDKSTEPRVRKGPAARLAQAADSSKQSELWPRVRKGPAYKELNKEISGPTNAESPNGSWGPSATPSRSARPHDDARHDAAIVALFRVSAEGWEFLMRLSVDELADIRARYSRGELDELAILEYRNRQG